MSDEQNIRKYGGFDIQARFKFAKKELLLTSELLSVVINFRNGQIVPVVTLKFILSTKYATQLLMPYTVDLKIIEKNLQDEGRTALACKLFSVSSSTALKEKPNTVETKPDRIVVAHTYVPIDNYMLENSIVGGIFENVSIKDVIQTLWKKTNHGVLNLNIGKFDNTEIFDRVWIPNFKYKLALNYITQYYGLYETPPIIYGDFDNFVISSLNEVTLNNKPLTIKLMQSSSKNELINVDEFEYGVSQLPSFKSNFNNQMASLPKKINTISHTSKDFYTRKSIDVIQHLRKLRNVRETDNFEEYLNTTFKPELTVLTNKSDYSLKESISNILLNTVSAQKLQISQPFRFNHWVVGRKIILKPQMETYEAVDSTMYLNGVQYVLINDNGRWNGHINAEVYGASTANVII